MNGARIRRRLTEDERELLDSLRPMDDDLLIRKA
jgi:hypothetical protein